MLVKIYADTSFLFSRCATDANSTKVDARRQTNPAPSPLTAFHRLCYYATGKRRIQSHSTYSEAKTEADAKVRDLANGNQSVALAAKEAIAGLLHQKEGWSGALFSHPRRGHRTGR
jgi:hypothetical protein